MKERKKKESAPWREVERLALFNNCMPENSIINFDKCS